MKAGSLIAAFLVVLVCGCNRLDTATIESELTPIKERACACTTQECSAATMQEIAEWGRKHKDARIEKDGQETLTNLVSATLQCWLQKGVNREKVRTLADELAELAK
jgi:hypothetical protein